MDYKPYSAEWHRYRYLKEALDRYLDDYVDNQTVVGDILDILNSRCVKAHQEFERTNELEYMLRKRQ